MAQRSEGNDLEVAGDLTVNRQSVIDSCFVEDYPVRVSLFLCKNLIVTVSDVSFKSLGWDIDDYAPCPVTGGVAGVAQKSGDVARRRDVTNLSSFRWCSGCDSHSNGHKRSYGHHKND
jgi:hypothetical protein